MENLLFLGVPILKHIRVSVLWFTKAPVNGVTGMIKDNFSYFLIKTYVVTLLLNRLSKTILVQGKHVVTFSRTVSAR